MNYLIILLPVAILLLKKNKTKNLKTEKRKEYLVSLDENEKKYIKMFLYAWKYGYIYNVYILRSLIKYIDKAQYFDIVKNNQNVDINVEDLIKRRDKVNFVTLYNKYFNSFIDKIVNLNIFTDINSEKKIFERAKNKIDKLNDKNQFYYDKEEFILFTYYMYPYIQKCYDISRDNNLNFTNSDKIIITDNDNIICYFISNFKKVKYSVDAIISNSPLLYAYFDKKDKYQYVKIDKNDLIRKAKRKNILEKIEDFVANVFEKITPEFIEDLLPSWLKKLGKNYVLSKIELFVGYNYFPIIFFLMFDKYVKNDKLNDIYIKLNSYASGIVATIFLSPFACLPAKVFVETELRFLLDPRPCVIKDSIVKSEDIHKVVNQIKNEVEEEGKEYVYSLIENSLSDIMSEVTI